ncbi:MAG: DUF1648 domain-containing protein [Methanoregulaceae archaeon]|nr:DUF1648 domain-containing protein [Methanoregulaceae archaeon]
MKPVRLAIIAVLFITFVISIALYPGLPDLIPTHWNAAGEVNGYMQKFWGVFLVPFLMLGFTALLTFIPRIDPKRANYAKFQDYYDGFILVFALFFLAVQMMILLWALGIPISPNILFPVLVGVLFFYIGILLDHTEPNWFVGIRTPWTLSSETVWRKTHKRGALAFKIAGVFMVSGILIPDYVIYLVLALGIGVAAYTVVYSYQEYQKEQHEIPMT